MNNPAEATQNQAKNITVLSVRACTKADSKALAYVSLRAGDITIHGVSVLRGEKGPWVSMPSRNSNDKWYPVVRVDDPTWSELVKTVLQATKDLK